MSEWKEYKLKDIAEIQTGPFGSQLHKSDYVPVGVPCIMPTNIGSHLDLSIDGIARIKEEDALRLSKHIVHTGDIVYARRGDIEKCAYIKDSQNGWFCGTGCLKVYNFKDNVLPLYIAYQLSTDRCKKLISKNAVGTTMPNLNTSILGDISLFVPQLKTQQNIASLLSSLDDKIAVNRRICENLEAQAQALFKHWFIDFAPFKDGKFVESELGMIPVGWRVGTLGEIADITMGQSPSGSSYNEYGIGAIFYQGRTEFGFRFPGIRLYTTEPKRFAEPLSTLLSVRAPVGDINIAMDKCCIGRGLASIKSFKKHNSFIYYLLKSLRRRFDVYNGEGTVFGSINKDTLNGMKIIVPTLSIVEELDGILKTIDKKILNSHQESSYLSTLRDSLLPKLMSGEIKV